MQELDQKCVNTIRSISMDCVESAKSGHPGMPMGVAPMAYILWTRFLRHNPRNPFWPDRDRFVLSAGHGSMLLYSLLYLTGYSLSMEELKNFRQWNSKTPGHPEFPLTPGVETTTGPLGQGFANGVGMAVAERHLSAHFNRPGEPIVDHFVYGIVSDGDLMEGLSHEAASLAGHFGLGKLVYLYDDNHISIEGDTSLTFTEDTLARFRAYNWHVQRVDEGNDLEAVEQAINLAREETNRPSLIAVRTHIGYGSPNKQDRASAHGEPLGFDEIRLCKENLGCSVDPPCYVPDEVLDHFRLAIERGEALERQWASRVSEFRKAHPDLAIQWDQWMNASPTNGWEGRIPFFSPDPKGLATRVSSGKVLNAVSADIPNLIGGSADLAPSNKTLINGTGDFEAGSPDGRNLRFGVREHAMGSLLNGMALHGGLIPYGGTFLVFSDYMRPAIRLAALMELKVIYIFTHDSIGLGEDGPTHQPIEQLASLRAIPNLTVIRPCDANETAEAWRLALGDHRGPVILALTRQKVPILDRNVYPPASGLSKGAYILRDTRDGSPDVLLMASGSEVHIALEAAQRLQEMNVGSRVISVPSWELFDQQPYEYRSRILPPEVKARIAVEAGSPLGWHRFIGDSGSVIGIDHFGASAPYETLYEKFGITTRRVVEEALSMTGFKAA